MPMQERATQSHVMSLTNHEFCRERRGFQPTGSRTNASNELTNNEFGTHLNAGTGNACAKQSSVTLDSILYSTNSIVFVGTFGGALLIGSKKRKAFI